MGLTPTSKSVIGTFINGRNAQDDFLQIQENNGGLIVGWIDANGVPQGTLATAAGGIGGSIASGQVAVGTGPNVIGGTPRFTFSSSSGLLALGTGGGSSSLTMTAGATVFQLLSLTAGNATIGKVGGSNIIFDGSSPTIALTTSGVVQVGAPTIASGVINFNGLTSGTAGLGVSAVTGNPHTILLPTATGAAGSVLTTDGNNPQQTSWSASPGITGTIASGQIAVGSGTNTIGGSSALTYASGTLTAAATTAVSISNSGATGTTLADTGGSGIQINSSGGASSVVISDTGTGFSSWTKNAGVGNLSIVELIAASDGNPAKGAAFALEGNPGVTGSANLVLSNGSGFALTYTGSSGTGSVISSTTGTINIQSNLSGSTGVLLTATSSSVEINSPLLKIDGKVSFYNNTSTVKAGVPSLVAASLLTAQVAAIPATTVYVITPSVAGLYRITYVATITTAASVSSSLGGTNGFQIRFTNANGDSVVKTSNPTTATVSAGNTTGTTISGVVTGYAAASTNLQYLFDYTSSGTAMAYDLAIYVEYLG